MALPEPPYPYGPAADPYAIPITVPYPPSGPLPPYGAPEPVLVQINDIRVTASMIYTPSGAFPLAGSRWTVYERWYPQQKIPTWAIVLAIVGFFCLTIFSLLFLLAKETTYQGGVQVHVASGPFQHMTWVPAAGPAQAQHVHAQVNYVRSLSI
jgi:hypothetical protein